MNTLFIPLQAQAAGQAAAGGSQMGFWMMILLLFAVMYFFMIRPQRKQQKELETFRAGLKKGDKVVTTGGIYGTVDEVTDRTSSSGRRRRQTQNGQELHHQGLYQRPVTDVASHAEGAAP